MVNINLQTNSANEGVSSAIRHKKILIIVIVFLILLAVSYVGLVIYADKIAKNDASVNSQYAAQYSALNKGGVAADVYDFQARMDLARSLAAKSDIVIPSLQELEKIMTSGAYINSYDFDAKGKTIKLSCIADGYDTMAKQILDFKSSDFFAGVSTGQSSIDASGKIDFDVILTLK